jgi:hypothetical protein
MLLETLETPPMLVLTWLLGGGRGARASRIDVIIAAPLKEMKEVQLDNSPMKALVANYGHSNAKLVLKI